MIELINSQVFCHTVSIFLNVSCIFMCYLCPFHRATVFMFRFWKVLYKNKATNQGIFIWFCLNSLSNYYFKVLISANSNFYVEHCSKYIRLTLHYEKDLAIHSVITIYYYKWWTQLLAQITPILTQLIFLYLLKRWPLMVPQKNK